MLFGSNGVLAHMRDPSLEQHQARELESNVVWWDLVTWHGIPQGSGNPRERWFGWAVWRFWRLKPEFPAGN